MPKYTYAKTAYHLESSEKWKPGKMAKRLCKRRSARLATICGGLWRSLRAMLYPTGLGDALFRRWLFRHIDWAHFRTRKSLHAEIKEGLINSPFHSAIWSWGGHQGEFDGHPLV